MTAPERPKPATPLDPALEAIVAEIFRRHAEAFRRLAQ